MVRAHEALNRLIDGNRRFVANARNAEAPMTHANRAQLAREQRPFAIILGCSDSRVPVEMVFDQGEGDLFVIRVAGNIVAPSQLGSIEFAAARFNTRLVVVLGHTNCGAIMATIEQILDPCDQQSPNLRSVVQRVLPALESIIDADTCDDMETLIARAVRANVQMAVDQIRHGSEIIQSLIQNEGLRIVGAEYSLETGQVDFFDRRDLP